MVAEGEDVVGDLAPAAPPAALDAAGADLLAAHPAVGDHAPAGLPQSGIDEFGAGLRLVHSAALLKPEYDNKYRQGKLGSAGET